MSDSVSVVSAAGETTFVHCARGPTIVSGGRKTAQSHTRLRVGADLGKERLDFSLVVGAELLLLSHVTVVAGRVCSRPGGYSARWMFLTCFCH